MNREWHQSAWQWLNHLDEIKKGVPCEHSKGNTADVGLVELFNRLPKGGSGMDLELRDKLSHYQAFARQCQLDADTKALAASIAERRYARANALVRELEKELNHD